MENVGHFIMKCWRSIHSLSSNIRSYSFVVLIMTGFGAWSVMSAIDALRQNGQLLISDGDAFWYKIFAGFCVFFFGAVVINQWYRLSQRMQHRNDDGTPRDSKQGTVKPDLRWPRWGVYLSVGIMTASEILSRIAIFLAPWPHVSLATLILTGFFAAFFTIPLFLTPGMTVIGEDAEKADRQKGEARIHQKIQEAAQQRLLDIHLAQIQTLSPTEFLAQYSDMVPAVNAVQTTVHEVEPALAEPEPLPQLPGPGTTSADEQEEVPSFLATDEQQDETLPRLLVLPENTHNGNGRKSAKSGKR